MKKARPYAAPGWKADQDDHQAPRPQKSLHGQQANGSSTQLLSNYAHVRCVELMIELENVGIIFDAIARFCPSFLPSLLARRLGEGIPCP